MYEETTITPATDTTIHTLGACGHESPLRLSTVVGDDIGDYIPERARTRYQVDIGTGMDNPDLLFEKAGPRQHIHFQPETTRVAIVTCGGLCPGINNVIRSATLELRHNYGVSTVLGLRHGFRGLNPDLAAPPLDLTTERVDNIHKTGGTLLASSRGAQDAGIMVDFLEKENIQILLCIGGDGTQHGAHEIAQEVLKRKANISVVGIPKTIDNDILFVQRTFGYTTAIDEARSIVDCAHTEAKGTLNGIGMVKIMGRESGFIAAGATLASQEPNFTLIPEIPLTLEGEKGFLNVLKQRILKRGHAVIMVAEGAGQDLMQKEPVTLDASGNKVHQDIGLFLKSRIKDYFAKNHIETSVKYIDPSYIVRSVPANSDDSLLCDQYARHAVHAAMAGKTDMLIGFWNASFIHVPIEMAVASRQKIGIESKLWDSVIATTGQPRFWK